MDRLVSNKIIDNISDKDFRRLCSTVYEICGISLSDEKKATVEARIRKRLIALNLNSYNEYFYYLFTKNGWQKEEKKLIEILTTNKTEFFRENNQIEYLINTVIPDLIKSSRVGINRELKIWSAGCSTGEEPYSLAMSLENFAETQRYFTYKIFASDISNRVLEKAKLAIYDLDDIDSIPESFRKKYLLKSKNPENRKFRIAPEIRIKVNFSNINLIKDFSIFPRDLDAIFCRNVIIYFDKKTQEELMINFSHCLNKDGFLFLGHSESTVGLKVPYKRIASSIYQVIKQ